MHVYIIPKPIVRQCLSWCGNSPGFSVVLYPRVWNLGERFATTRNLKYVWTQNSRILHLDSTVVLALNYRINLVRKHLLMGLFIYWGLIYRWYLMLGIIFIVPVNYTVNIHYITPDKTSWLTGLSAQLTHWVALCLNRPTLLFHSVSRGDHWCLGNGNGLLNNSLQNIYIWITSYF